MTRLTLCFVAACVMAATGACAAQASEKNIALASFNQLTLSKGLVVTLKCADKPYMVASATPKVLDKLQVSSSANTLNVTGTTRDFEGWDLSDNKTDLTIYTDKPVSAITTMFGVKLRAEACAIDQQSLRVNGSMGSSFAISGHVAQLDTELAMGAKFNSDTDDLQVENANVSVAMGAEANLCGARKASGSAAMGALVYVDAHTENSVNAAMGATVRNRNCQQVH